MTSTDTTTPDKAVLREEILAELRRLAREEAGLTQEPRLTDRLVEDLGLDSVQLAVIATGLERRYGIDLIAGACHVQTVADVVALVDARLEALP